MKHCSNCPYCIEDLRAFMMFGINIHKCRLKGHFIARPFFEGFRCNVWRKKK